VSAVVGHCINIESRLGVPTVPLIISQFHDPVQKTHVIQKGMPGLRVTYLISPVWGKTREQIRKDIVGKSPVSGKMIMEEIVENLTKPLTAEEKKTGTIQLSAGPERFTDTPDRLQQYFMDNRMTDYLPIVLPTEDRVAEMLKGTSHSPDEVVGKMAAHTQMGGPNDVEIFRHWSYTVKTVAINAVMAGARPEYLPVILAVASTGKEALSVSDNSFTEALIINGPVRDEIKLNYGLGAMGPFSQANSTIGRAWNLLSLNAGDCGRVGTTYMGTVGNPMNWNDVIIAENEQDSPWKPYHIRKGFKPTDSVVTLCEGWGVLSAKNSKYSVWQKDMDFPGIAKKIVNDQDGLFGALLVLNPTVANFIKEAGYDTVEKFTDYLLAPAEGQAAPRDQPSPKGKMPFGRRLQVSIAVTGGSNNNYWSYGGMACRQSVSIDKWR
jgi:hypothetical protein